MDTAVNSLSDVLDQCRLRVGAVQSNAMGLVLIHGADVASFLQAQVTNDVQKLEVGDWHWSALLDRKAMLLAWFQLVRLSEQCYGVIAEQSQCEPIATLLERVHFVEDVTIRVQPSLQPWVAAIGPWAAHTLTQMNLPIQSLTQAHQCLQWEAELNGTAHALWAIPSDYWGVSGYWVLDAQYIQSQPDTPLDITPIEATHEALWSTLTQALSQPLPVIMPEALERLRLEAGLCRYGVDMSDAVALPATGLEWVSVNYEKGCYPGQEVVAKVRTYGAMPRGLMGVRCLEAQWPDMPPKGLAYTALSVLSDGKAIGTIYSRGLSPTLNQSIGLAYLDKAYRIPGQTLQVNLTTETTSTSATLETVALPFVPPTQPQVLAKNAYDDAINAFAQEDDDRAIALLESAIAYNPLMADAYEALGVILGRHKRYDEAIALMETLKTLDPDCVMAHSNLSVFYMELGDKDRAEEEKAKATVLSFSLQMKKQRQQQDDAQQRTQQQAALTEKLAMFQEVLGLDPDDTLANYGLGSAYVELEQYEKAIEPLKKAIAQNENYTVAYLALVKACKGLTQWGEARSMLAKGLEVAQRRGDLMPLKQLQALEHQIPSG